MLRDRGNSLWCLIDQKPKNVTTLLEIGMEQQRLLSQWSAKLETSSGLRLHVRPASPEDEVQLAQFFDQASPDDLRFRFLNSIRSVSNSMTHQMTAVDHTGTENLLAFDARDYRLAASAMLVFDDRMEDAEVAIIVRSDLKGRGIGWDMLNHACEYARARGARKIHSVEVRDNRSGIALEHQQGFTGLPCVEDTSLMILTKDLCLDEARRP